MSPAGPPVDPLRTPRGPPNRLRTPEGSLQPAPSAMPASDRMCDEAPAQWHSSTLLAHRGGVTLRDV
eukprot:278358-Prorocentrum_minimum.AAC.1